MDGQLDVPFVGLLEQKNDKSRFVRVDADVLDRLIVKADTRQVELTEPEREVMTTVFRTQLPKLDKSDFMVNLAALGENDKPLVITQSEYMRRMKEMAQYQPGMSFYGEMPDSYTLTLNTDHPLMKRIIADANAAVADKLTPLDEQLTATQNVIKAIRDLDKDGKGVPEDKKQDLKDNEDRASELREQKTAIVAEYAAGQPVVKQLVDIALLGNGLLKGEALSAFLNRSIELL